jgi:hypothetical protein
MELPGAIERCQVRLTSLDTIRYSVSYRQRWLLQVPNRKVAAAEISTQRGAPQISLIVSELIVMSSVSVAAPASTVDDHESVSIRASKSASRWAYGTYSPNAVSNPSSLRRFQDDRGEEIQRGCVPTRLRRRYSILSLCFRSRNAYTGRIEAFEALG